MPSRRAGEPLGVAPVWVRDRHGTGLPYSKGLMAASIMATGLAPQRAHQLAGIIEGQLRALGSREVCAEDLMDLAAAVLSRFEGPEVSERYLAWRRAKRSPSPLVVLIGGVTGVGKSTVATKLAARLDIPRVVPTDAVREIMRGLLSPADAPEIHRSSFEGDGNLIYGFMWQAATVASGVMGLVERTVVERRDLIVEGVHLVPGTLPDGRLRRLQEEAVVVHVVLTIDNPAVHRSHFLHRLDNEHGRDPARYLARLADIRHLQGHVVRLARRHGVPIVEAHSLDDALQRVLELVVAEVTQTAATIPAEAS